MVLDEFPQELDAITIAGHNLLRVKRNTLSTGRIYHSGALTSIRSLIPKLQLGNPHAKCKI